MSEFTRRYYPTICVRRAEMRALENLPETEKRKMLPVVLLAPWLNSISFDNTFNIIKKAIGDIPIIADIDRHYASSSNLPSRNFFNKLIDADHGPDLWMELISSHENYIPSIQHVNVAIDLVRKQVEFAKSLKRGFVLRIEIQRDHDLEKVLSIARENIDQNFIVIVDYGYTDKSEDIELLISQTLDRFFAISNDMNIVISGSSFPNSFLDYDNFSSSKIISSRAIYRSLSRKYGNYNFYYGDWASTKPRIYDGGGAKPLPRIDLPTSDRWIISRSKEDEWDFQTAAEMVTRLPEWEARPLVWGTGVIEKAAKGLPGGITTGPQAIAARVNIHLYLQNNFGNVTPLSGPQGKWVDPI